MGVTKVKSKFEDRYVSVELLCRNFDNLRFKITWENISALQTLSLSEFLKNSHQYCGFQYQCKSHYGISSLIKRLILIILYANLPEIFTDFYEIEVI